MEDNTEHRKEEYTKTILKWAKNEKAIFLKRSKWLIDIQNGV